MTLIRTILVALVLGALTLAGCGGGGAGNPESNLSPDEAQAPLDEGAPPKLAVIRDQANDLLEGGNDAFKQRLAELKGTPVVVNKWASWCGPCRLEFPFFQSQALERGAQIAFLGVLSDDSEAAGETFLEELPLPYPSYLDPDKDIAQEIDSIAFPATAFYDRSGQLVYTKQGQYADEAALAADIDRYAKSPRLPTVPERDNGDMELVIILAAIAVGLMLVELLAPTGGLLALIGACGLVAAGIVAIENDSSDALGAGLITAGVLSLIAVFIITPKVLRAHRDEPVRTGWEELVGKEAEVREPLDPVGQVWVDGALWKAEIGDGEPAIGLGNRVLIESVDGLTLVVKPVGGGTEPVQKGT